MNYTNSRINRRCVSRSSIKSNIKQSKVFDNEIKRDNITAAAAIATGHGHSNKNINITTTRDRSCIQTILDSLDGYYNDDERVQVTMIKPPIRNLSFSSLNTQLQLQIPKEIIKKESPSPPPTVPSTPKHSTMKKGLPRRRHSLPDTAKLPDNVKFKQWADTAARTPRPQSSAHIKQTRRRRHTLSGKAERPDISCIQSFIRQANIHEEDYYHHQPKNKLAGIKTHEFERVDQTHSRAVETDHNQSFASNNNQQKKSQVKRIITERRRRHSMPDNMRAPNPSDLLMSLPLSSTNRHGKGLDKQRTPVAREKILDHASSTPPPDMNKNEDNNKNDEKYRYKVGQTLQDATSHSLRFTSKSQATKLLSQLSLNTPLFVKRTSNNQQWQAQWQARWSYCLLVKHIYNESKLIGVEVSLTDIQEEGKDKKSRVRTKIIEERYFERWLMMVNYKTVLVQESTATPATATATDSPTYYADDQTDMATRGSESNQVNEDRPPRMIFQVNKEDVISTIYSSSSSSSSSSSGGASSSNEFYSVISSTESFTSSSIYSSSSSDTSSSYGHDIPGRYLDFNSPIPLSNTDDVSTTSASTTSARSSCCSSGASDQVLIASKSARVLRASF